jgi:hypothetical protein
VKNSKRTAGVSVRLLKFKSRRALLDYLQGVKLTKKKK